MRSRLTLVVAIVALAAAGSASAQATKKKVPAPVTSRTVLANLQTEVKSNFYMNAMRFSELLELAGDDLRKAGCDVNFSVDDEAFREENPDLDVFDQEIRLRGLPASSSVHQIVRAALKKLPVKTAMVIRGGKVEIVPASRTEKAHMLNQTFHIEFKERRFDEAIEQLSDLTGVSIVVDARARQKAQTTISARFCDDVALQDDVRILSDMAELKVVYLVTGLYVTTPEQAKTLQKELRDLYEGPVVPLLPLPDPTMSVPMIGTPPFESPLAPQLPPSKSRREAAASYN